MSDKSRQKCHSSRGKGRPPRGGLPDSVVETMWAAYQEDQTCRHVAKAAGVNPTTAHRYITRGRPSANIRPFRERLAEIRAKAEEIADLDLAKIRAKAMLAASRLMDAIADGVEDLPPPKDQVRAALALSYLNRVMQDLAGIETQPKDGELAWPTIPGFDDEEPAQRQGPGNGRGNGSGAVQVH